MKTTKQRLLIALLLVAGVLIVLGATYISGAQTLFTARGQNTQQPVQADEWPTYMHDGARSGFNPGEVRLSPANASKLTLLWKQKLGDIIAAQPIVKGGTVYASAWNGFLYALNATDGSIKWKVDLGQTQSPRCVPSKAGITSAPAVTDNALYIGGGNQFFYALDPRTGTTLWKFQTGDNSPTGGAYNWTSPLFFNNRVYYGIASLCDNPFPQGQMWGLDPNTGQVKQTLDLVPDGFGGGGLWTSPTVDQASGNLFLTTASAEYYIPYAYSMVRLDPQSLSVVDSWEIPLDEQIFDGDWGTTPILFTSNAGKQMVGAAAKNGKYYAFDANNITPGPAWEQRIANAGQCPQCGEGVVSSSAYAYDTLYAAGGYMSLGDNRKFAGSVHALDPTTGAARWLHPTSGYVIAPLAVANGLVAAAANNTIEVLNAANGDLLWEYATGATIYAGPTIAGGTLYVGSTDGYLYAFSAGPYPTNPTAYKVGQVGASPPQFTPFRTPVAAQPLPGAQQCFPETGKCVRGDFLKYWNDNGGLARFGPAVTNELTEAGLTVQYFQNAELELAPNPDGTGMQTQLDNYDFRLSYIEPTNPRFDPADPAPGATYISQTKHNMIDPILSFWKTHGDVAVFGYPVSEQFSEYDPIDGQTRTVQYFERARLEIATDQNGSQSVVLGSIGVEKYKQRYGKLP